MAFGIGSILFALALVLILGLTTSAQQSGSAGKSLTVRQAVAQTQDQAIAPAEEGGFKAIVVHPPERTDFQSLEQAVHAIADARELPIEYHALNNPQTGALLQKLRIRMAPNQTMVIFEAPNGAITWGSPEEGLSEATADLVFPTPRMCEVIMAAQTGNDVLLVFRNDEHTGGEQMVSAATAYAQVPENKAELFVIDPDDPSNADLITRTQLPPDSLKTARMLLLVGGRVQGQLTGTVGAKDIEALKKSCSGKAGCC